jgi:hypothetical protein
MASFGASDAATDPTGTLVGPVQQPEIAAADPRSAHGA